MTIYCSCALYTERPSAGHEYEEVDLAQTPALYFVQGGPKSGATDS